MPEIDEDTIDIETKDDELKLRRLPVRQAWRPLHQNEDRIGRAWLPAHPASAFAAESRSRAVPGDKNDNLGVATAQPGQASIRLTRKRSERPNTPRPTTTKRLEIGFRKPDPQLRPPARPVVATYPGPRSRSATPTPSSTADSTSSSTPTSAASSPGARSRKRKRANPILRLASLFPRRGRSNLQAFSRPDPPLQQGPRAMPELVIDGDRRLIVAGAFRLAFSWTGDRWMHSLEHQGVASPRIESSPSRLRAIPSATIPPVSSARRTRISSFRKTVRRFKPYSSADRGRIISRPCSRLKSVFDISRTGPMNLLPT